MDKALDRGRGRGSLSSHGAAASVQREILACEGERYALIAWCVMPTHIHVLLSEMEDWPVAEIVAQWKSRTLAAANTRRFLRRGASAWAKDHFKTDIVGDTQIADVRSYIEYNPVMNGLARDPRAWAWSSASDPRAEVDRS